MGGSNCAKIIKALVSMVSLFDQGTIPDHSNRALDELCKQPMPKGEKGKISSGISEKN